MKRNGNISRSYIDSFGLPRTVFGRMVEMSDPMAESTVDLEGALPTAMCMTSWNNDRVPQVRSGRFASQLPALVTSCLILIRILVFSAACMSMVLLRRLR